MTKLKDNIFKIKILILAIQDNLLNTFLTWGKEVWKRDLDSHYCCDGIECGCQGSTIREVYTRTRKSSKNG